MRPGLSVGTGRAKRYRHRPGPGRLLYYYVASAVVAASSSAACCSSGDSCPSLLPSVASYSCPPTPVAVVLVVVVSLVAVVSAVSVVLIVPLVPSITGGPKVCPASFDTLSTDSFDPVSGLVSHHETNTHYLLPLPSLCIL